MKATKLTGAALAAAVLLLAACSSSGGSSTSTTTTTGSSTTAATNTSAAGSGLASAEAAVKAGSSFPVKIPVTEALPSKPPTGKTVVFLQCEAQTCGQEGSGIKAATAAIGWKYQVVNFQAANPATLVTALKTALQYNPVGVFFAGVPQAVWASMQASYASAGAFITENFEGETPSGPGVEPGRGYADAASANGKLMADEQVADAHGAPSKSLLVNVPAYPVFVPLAKGYEAEIKATCAACSVMNLDVTLPQLQGGQLIPAVVSAVKRTPGITYIIGVNAAFVTQLPAALKAAGLDGKYKIIAGRSGAADQQNVLSGAELAVLSGSLTMGGWQDVDMAIRKVMNLPIPAGDHVARSVLLTKQNVGTPADSYDLPTDYAAQFEALWQVGK